MKAWEVERNIRISAKPDPSFTGNYDTDSFAPDLNPDWYVRILWSSRVPGSGAPESLILGAIQAVENRGRDVSKALEIYLEGLRDLENGDTASLRVKTARIFSELEKAPKVEHPHHFYRRPLKWYEISRDFPKEKCDVEEDLEERIHDAWLGQIAGAAMGTRLEGYTAKALEEVYGDELGYYISTPPSTVNDDITYEIAFMLAFERKGRGITPDDVADEWLEKIRFGWSAELIALENLKRGLYPPESGSFRNPFQEWIGAQMRGMVHGILNPGNPYKAARFAYVDSIVSHSGNGVYGGIHSAVLTSLAFCYDDPRELVLEAEKFVPDGTEFKDVLVSVRRECEESSHWKDVLEFIEERFKTHNWIHLYPNAGIVVTALWFASDFDSAMEIVARSGYDVDCNAGEVGTVFGIISGVPDRWKDPLNDTLETYVPGFERVSIRKFSKWSFELTKGRGKDGGEPQRKIPFDPFGLHP